MISQDHVYDGLGTDERNRLAIIEAALRNLSESALEALRLRIALRLQEMDMAALQSPDEPEAA